MPILNTVVIRRRREELLSKIEEFAAALLADMERREAGRRSFWFYVDFCSPMILDLIAWERINSVDLETLPSIKRLFFETARSARDAIHEHGHRDPLWDKGKGRRTFTEIAQAELAANVLPKLEHILFSWGISYDSTENSFVERKLTEDEECRLTKYFGDP